MMRSASVIGALVVAAIAGTARPATGAEPATIVFCAPGYPGTAEQAQPTMDALAEAVRAAAGRPSGSVAAVYEPSAEGGEARLRDPGAALGVVTLPFFLRYREKLALHAHLAAIPVGGDADERWALVARKGAVARPADLAGFEITGAPGFAPAFVRGPILGAWGTLPPDCRVTFTPRALSALRRAVAGERVAVLLDAAATAALASLPFAADLEVVTRSAPLPANVVCTVGSDRPAGALLDALGRLADAPGGAAALDGIRVERFVAVDRERLAAVEASYAGAGGER